MADSNQFVDVPYVIVALAPFAPTAENQGRPHLIPVDLSSLDEAMEQLAPTLRIAVNKSLCPDAWVTVAPRALRDFRPERLLRTSPYLRDIDDALKSFKEARTGGQDALQVAEGVRQQWPHLPLDYSVLQSSEQGGAASSKAVDDILSMVASSGSGGGKTGGLDGLVTQAEGLLAGVLQTVYDDDGFRAFEAAWRGVELILKQSGAKEGSGITVQLGVADPGAADFLEMLDDLAMDLAGDLPNLVLVDAELDSAPARIEYSRGLADFAETLLAPTVAGVGAGFFHLQDWSELGKIPYINHFLEDASFAKWRNLRKEPGGRWLGAAINPILARPKYGQDARPRTVFFSEARPLWLNPAWGVAALAAKSVATHGWPSRLTDYHSVSLTDLPVQGADDGSMATAIRMGEDRIEEFAEAGFIPLVGMVHKDTVLGPKAPAVSGDPLAPQLFLNRVLDFLFWCKENLAGEIESGDVAANLQAAFSLFWQRTGHQPPSDLRISAGEPEEGSLPLAIHFTPPRDVLAAATTLEFTFSW